MPTSSGPLATSRNGTDPQLKQWSSLVGIITAIVGNILISFALNTQRYAHIRINREFELNNDRQAKKARKHLPKAIRNYGTAIRQEQAAEERARVNAVASSSGDLGLNEEDQPLLGSDENRRHSDDTLKPKEDDEEDTQGRKSYLKSPWWWLGIVMMTIGEAGNFLAYGFAPASIVSPLGVVALISNCLIAPLMLKERFRQRDFWGVAIAIAGAVTVVFSANQSEQKLGPGGLWRDVKRWEFLVYVLVTVILIAALMFLSPKYGQRTILIDLGLVGLFGGYTALSTKGVASLLSGSLYRAFAYPIFYVLVLILVLSAVMQIRYLNRALQNFDSTQVIPVQFVLFTLSVIIGSAVLYRDFQRTTSDHAIKFVIGCFLTFCGVYLITSGRKQQDNDDEDSIHEQDQIHLVDEEANLENQTQPSKGESNLNTIEIDDRDVPRTPKQHSRDSSQAPSIVVTPAGETPPAKPSLGNLNHNPWISSTDHLATAIAEPPRTPTSQTMPESSQTPFFTPATTLHRPQGPQRTASSPGQPETPTRRRPSPPKVDEPRTFHTARGSISRLMPGPLMPPLSSSLSGIVADSLRRGEGAPSNIRAALRRHRTFRDPRRRSVQGDGDPLMNISDPAFISGSSVPSVYGSETHISRTNSHQATTPSGKPNEGGKLSRSGSLTKNKGRLRSMSATLSELMVKARGKGPETSKGAAAADGSKRNSNDRDDDDDNTPDGRLP